MSNNDIRQLRNAFALPKVAVTRIPSLDPVMAAQCSKSMKTNDNILARLQVLTLDAVRLHTHILEKLNSDESEINANKVGYAMEYTIKLIENASSQMSILRRQKILKNVTRTCSPLHRTGEKEFIRAAPQLFWAQFPKEAADHLDQLAAIRRAKSSFNNQGFSQGYSFLIGQASDRTPNRGQNPIPGQREAESIKKHEMTINVVCRCWNKFIKHYESYDAESMEIGIQKAQETMESGKVIGRLAYLVDTWKVLTKQLGY